jgi:putative ABC transport system ATP-binding protein
MKNVMLQAANLCKSYANNGTQNHVLRNINLELYEGEFTVIMGSSGSGKSTLLYSLSGMDRATSGEITYNGLRLDNLKEDRLAMLRRSSMGFVFQQMHLVQNLTVFENITVAGYINKKLKPKEVEKKALGLLQMMGIERLADRLPSQVSGGEQQRAAIARALINSPSLVFADEPTGALNSKSGHDILDILSELNAEGQSVLMVTHDVKAALRAGRLIYLIDGKIADEMQLPKYTAEGLKARESQVLSWLSSMGW